jgi:hypothetical protein
VSAVEPPNVNALVEALDARARQAGSEGAMTLLRGMLGTVSETMATIDERLERLEGRAAERSGEMALAEAVQGALTNFNARLGRLEEAFVQAVEESGSGTQQIVDQIREAVVASLPPAEPVVPVAPAPSPEVTAAAVVDAVRPVLDGLAHRLAKLERIEADVRSLLDRPLPEPPQPPPPLPPPPPPEPAIDPEVVERLESAVAALGRDEASARTVALVEERIAAVVKAVADRTDDLRRAIDAQPRPDLQVVETELRRLADGLADRAVPDLHPIEAELRRLADRPWPEAPAPAPPVDLQPIEAELRRLADRPWPEPPAPAPPVDLQPIEAELRRLADRPWPEPAPPTPGVPVEELVDVVRRESELLTQRVAALAVGVEATRAMLEAHVADTEASLGRKASEVGRRLAADLGLRSRRNARRRDRELGPGAS